ncbi:MAG: cobalamin-independent methionine synthase II family protein [Stellaceae bacterium]
MKTSQDRILTSHVGSLPRTETIIDLLTRRENGTAFDPAEFDRRIVDAVCTLVSRQVEIGIDVVSDGEASKISYATYVHDRLTGFADAAQEESARPHRDLQPFPEFRRRMALLTGTRRFKRVACIGPVAYRDRAALARDLANMRRAVDAARPVEAFLNAASPGVVASFLRNRYYPSHDQYVVAVAEAMRVEYEAIVAAGFVLQIDCPDLAMSRHAAFQDLSEGEFLRRAALHVDALNHALGACPADRVRIHVCWGNYEGPHDYDIDLRRIVAVILRAKAQLLSLEAANPRHEHEWAVWREVNLPEDKILMPGVVDSSTNYVEHPELVAQRILRFVDLVGRQRVIAGTDCGFGTSAGFGKIDPEIAFLKLRSLVEGAALASRAMQS